MLPRKKETHAQANIWTCTCVACTPVLRHRHRLLEEILLKTRGEKLENREKKQQPTENMAQAMFVSIFVCFVVAVAEGTVASRINYNHPLPTTPFAPLFRGHSPF